MSRPHICFLQSQALSWSSVSLPALGDVQAKVLSRDRETGDITCIVHTERHLEQTNACFSRGAEFYVLAGQGELDGLRFERDAYVFVCADTTPRIVLEAGTTALMMTGAGGRALSDDPVVDTYALPWKTGVEGSVTGKPLSPTIFTKKLRYDNATGEQSFLYAALPQHLPPKVMPGRFGHPMVEEIFVLSGEYAFGDVGRMGPGGYVWWREDVYHGPAGSAAGYNLLIRVHGGPLQNEFESQPAPFSLTPEHRPALPKSLTSCSAPYPFPPQW